MTTWRIELEIALNTNQDLWEDIVFTTLSKEELDTEFDEGFGPEKGAPFTLWTKDFVYFPACYDGSEWVASVPRNPKYVKTYHIGGG